MNEMKTLSCVQAYSEKTSRGCYTEKVLRRPWLTDVWTDRCDPKKTLRLIKRFTGPAERPFRPNGLD